MIDNDSLPYETAEVTVFEVFGENFAGKIYWIPYNETIFAWRPRY